MLALDFNSELIEGLIVLVIIVGSALTGLAKSIITKINERKQAQKEAREQLLSPPPREAESSMSPRPVARPMPPRRPVGPRMETPPGQPVEFDVPQSMRPVVEMLLGKIEVEEDEPAPAQVPPPRRPSVEKPRRPATERSPRMQRIERREEAQSKKVEQRIGQVETHVASAPIEVRGPRSRIAELSDRASIRKAIVLNEILGLPVSMR